MKRRLGLVDLWIRQRFEGKEGRSKCRFEVSESLNQAKVCIERRFESSEGSSGGKLDSSAGLDL
jgi:hypothetical protein